MQIISAARTLSRGEPGNANMTSGNSNAKRSTRELLRLLEFRVINDTVSIVGKSWRMRPAGRGGVNNECQAVNPMKGKLTSVVISLYT